MPNNTVFKGFGGTCEATNNGDTVVRYDQLADRWLIVMPTFRRGAVRPDQPPVPRAGAQNVMRWEDYTQTAVDPSDDCTVWYVGDYIKQGETSYSSRIGAFRMPGCKGKR